MEVENVEDGTGKDQLIFVSKGQGSDGLLFDSSWNCTYLFRGDLGDLAGFTALAQFLK